MVITTLRIRWFLAVLALTLSHAGLVLGAGVQLKTQRVASGLNRPVYATAPAGDTNRLFILEQHTGNIRILDLNTNTLLPGNFLNISGLSTGNEQGLLGLAFDPNYTTNGFFYVNYTDNSGSQSTHIRRYRVQGDPATSNVADAGSALDLMTYAQPFANHNGGWIGFGPNDPYLYIASGDGGSGNDPGNRAQDITDQPLGKILRIDVRSTDPGLNYAIPPSNPFVGVTGDDEIWAYGLRNPWRASFDRETGDFWIGDVGQSAREEIDFQPANSPGGENYGWRLREGTVQNPSGVGGPAPPGAIDPIFDYDNNSEGIAVTGGYVYRGGEIPSLQGTYIFGDYLGPFFTGGKIWSFRYDGQAISEFTDRTAELSPDVGTLREIVSFAEDARGELYVIDLGGDVYRILADFLPGDANGDGEVDLIDYEIVQSFFGIGTTRAQGDFNEDGVVNLTDLRILKENFTGSPEDLATIIPSPATLSVLAFVIAVAAMRRRRV